MKKQFWAFTVFLVAILIPGVAYAGPGEAIYELAQRVWELVSAGLFPFGLEAWGLVASLVCTILTMVWVVGLNKKLRQNIGRLSGFAALPIALMIMWMIIGLGVGMATGLAQGLITKLWASIPIINMFPNLVAFLGKTTWLIVSIFLVIAMVKHLVTSGVGYFKQLIGIFKHILVGPIQGRTLASHLLIGGLLVSAIINRQELNETLYYIPSMASCLLGLYTLVFVRPEWSKIKKEYSKSHAVKHGTLPYDREIEGEQDRQVMEEALKELDKEIALKAFERKLDEKQRIEDAEREQYINEAVDEVEALLDGNDPAFQRLLARRQRIHTDIETFDAKKEEELSPEETEKMKALQAQVDADADADAEAEAEAEAAEAAEAEAEAEAEEAENLHK